ncbi:uncharacterized protein F4817DRAFT_334859 [Daldinia loculata]|uniref:uncharacterized protein n=1 Tax=Daldinia loculata TaxID=103429 RepID=UPI0020C4D5B1|nr:uncharacterized protein F4817DRAFT_334859 [Daldinia loculata]KAI1648091.1 hypothetical protein F4817DRAFT_334859 [Daldinia loculata]
MLETHNFAAQAKKFYLVPDTSSSDIWVVSDGFKCLAPFSGLEIPQKECAFGPIYKGDLPDGQDR